MIVLTGSYLSHLLIITNKHLKLRYCFRAISLYLKLYPLTK